MNEAEIREELIAPALKVAGWGVVGGSRVRREVIAPGQPIGVVLDGGWDIADGLAVGKGRRPAVKGRPYGEEET